MINLKSDLSAMGRLCSQSYINSTGTKVVAKMMPLGINRVKLASVGYGTARNGNIYISMIFTRPKSFVSCVTTKVTWSPQQEFIFDEEKASMVCNIFDYNLKPKPDDMDLNDYMIPVAARINTFIGKEIEILIGYEKVLKKDSYGQVMRSIVYREDSEAIGYYHARALAYFKVGEGVADWNMLHSMFFGLDK